jgi:hypothetical protein
MSYIGRASYSSRRLKHCTYLYSLRAAVEEVREPRRKAEIFREIYPGF